MMPDPSAHPGVTVRTAAGKGLGLFATTRFAPGAQIRERVVVREVTEQAPLGPDDNPEHATLMDDRLLLVGYPDRYLNHSCDPNAFLQFEGDRIFLVARRAIASGEEITLDYLINNSGGDSWPCGCGAARCRGETGSGFFSLPREIQLEYLPLLAPWFTRRHRAELEALVASTDQTDRADPNA